MANEHDNEMLEMTDALNAALEMGKYPPNTLQITLSDPNSDEPMIWRRTLNSNEPIENHQLKVLVGALSTAMNIWMELFAMAPPMALVEKDGKLRPE